MQPQNMNIWIFQNEGKLSFGISQEDFTEEWNLSDDLLWEDVQANLPTSIKSLNENMQRAAYKVKRNAHSFDCNMKSNDEANLIQTKIEFNRGLKSVVKFKSTTLKNSLSLVESENIFPKRSLKDDISYLLKKLVDNKKRKSESSQQIHDEFENNKSMYVTMKEIEAINNE